MKIYEMKDYQAMSRKVAGIIAAQIINKPDCVLGLATGTSPIGIYEYLIDWYKAGDLDFSSVSSVNLDEYKDISSDHEQSYRYFMNTKLFNHVNINKDATHLPNGMEIDSSGECARYEALVDSLGGIDLQLLGIGHNGHIGFNEPSDCFAQTTHCVDLQESTINANKRLFPSIDDVPKQAYTMGCGTIMKAKKIIIIATGTDKADIVSKAFFGPVTPQVPASLLQFHPDVTLVGDADALSKIPQV